MFFCGRIGINQYEYLSAIFNARCDALVVHLDLVFAFNFNFQRPNSYKKGILHSKVKPLQIGKRVQWLNRDATQMAR